MFYKNIYVYFKNGTESLNNYTNIDVKIEVKGTTTLIKKNI